MTVKFVRKIKLAQIQKNILKGKVSYLPFLCYLNHDFNCKTKLNVIVRDMKGVIKDKIVFLI